jgi:Cof subfamily protein (haloacid dehalogenase superfamily)
MDALKSSTPRKSQQKIKQKPAQPIENKRSAYPQIATKVHFFDEKMSAGSRCRRVISFRQYGSRALAHGDNRILRRNCGPRYNIPMPIRMIAMDLDGTLLDSHWVVPEENRAAISEAAARGIEVVLVTGRRFDFALPIANGLPCELTMIVNNGALIKTRDGATHLRHLLPRGVAREVLAATQKFRIGTAVVFDRPRERQVVFEQIDWEDPGRKGYFERNREYLVEISPLEDCLDEDPIQVMFTGPVEPMRDAVAILRAHPAAKQFAVSVTEYEARNFSIVDVIRLGCSKGAALAEWAQRRGVAREDVMAIGDNWNDREMLEFAGLPVVMGNSSPELKSLGWAVTLSNDQDGVAHAIRTYALGRT